MKIIKKGLLTFLSLIIVLTGVDIPVFAAGSSVYGVSDGTKASFSGPSPFNGPGTAYVNDPIIDGSDQGDIIAFTKDAGANQTSGYPLIRSDELDRYVNFMKGNKDYVKGRLKPIKMSYTKSGTTTRLDMLSLAEIANLSGGKGDWSNSSFHENKFVTSNKPEVNINTEDGKRSYQAGTPFKIHGFVKSDIIYSQSVNVTVAGQGIPGGKKTYTQSFPGQIEKQYTSPWETITINSPGTYTYTADSMDAVERRAVTAKITITITAKNGAAPAPVGGSTSGRPVADFDMPTSAKVKTDVYVKDLSKPSPGAQLSKWNWVVSPNNKTGLMGSGTNRIQFTQEGSYDVTLTITDTKNLTDTVTKTIYVGDSPAPPTPAPPAPDPGPTNEPPHAKFSMPSSIKVGGTVDVVDGSYDSDGTITDWNWDLSPSSGADDSLSDTGGTITFDKEGTYTLKLTVTDDAGDTDSYERDIDVKNRPPVARISLPSDVYQGDDINIKSTSYDPDGTIADTKWIMNPSATDGGMKDSTTGQPATLSAIENKVFFDKPGEYNINVTVTDDNGKSDATMEKLVVKPAIPNAHYVLVEGSWPKQNRKVVFDASTSTTAKRYPIDHTKTEWEIIRPDGVAADRVKIVNNPDKRIITTMFKEPGIYKIRVRVTNSAGHTSPWYEQPLEIYPDLAPDVDFYVTKLFTRDADNARKSTIQLEDRTNSFDGDQITKRVWKYRYDSNNDGNFLDEQWVTLDSGNNPTPSLVTPDVGKYQFELYVEESFGQPTIPEFIVPADKRFGDTSTKLAEDKITEVINLRPSVSFKPVAKKKVNIVFTVGNIDAAKLGDLNSRIAANIVTKLGANKVDYKIQSVATTSLNMQDTFAWQEYSNNFTDEAFHGYNGSNNHIAVEGKSIKFFGYGQAAMKDFLFMPNNVRSKKTFDFFVDEAVTDWHTLEGAGYLFNATINSGNLSGYVVILANGSYQLWKIPLVNVNSFHGGSYNSIANVPGAQMVGSYPKSGSQHTIHIEASPDKIDLWDNGNKVIDSVPLTDYYGNGFGPMAAYFGHGCSSLSKIEFKNIKMEMVEGKTLDEALKEPEWTDGSLRFVVSITDKEMAEMNDPAKASIVYSRLLEGAIDYSVLGTNTNKAQAQGMVAQNDGKGTFIDNSNMDAALSAYGDYIMAKVNELQGSVNDYVLLDQEVTYDTYYSDAENDPEYEQRWKYQHDPNFYQNSLGLVGYNDQFIANPVLKFDKVGKFGVTFQKRDNPKNDNRFDNYRLWAYEPEEPLYLHVHRRPFADFIANYSKVNNNEYNFSVVDRAYDLDHEFEPGKGIVQHVWKWKVGNGNWTNGVPNKLWGGNIYSIYHSVLDKEGVWSNPEVKIISLSGNLPPIADFNVTPNPINTGGNLAYTDNSYDPNPGDWITQWAWRLQTPAGNWIDYGGNRPNQLSTLGKYKIELKVKDSQGAWSDPFIQTVMVIPNNQAPVARFTVTPNPIPEDVKETFNDTSYDPDSDPIVAREWRYSKNWGVWVNSKPTDIGKLGVGTYRIQLRVKDQPALSQLTPLWSNWYEQTVTVVDGNKPPIAKLAVSPNPVPADEPLTWTDTSTDPEGKTLVAYDMRITHQGSGMVKQFTGAYGKASGASLNMTDRFISIFENSSFPDEGVGTYTIEYRVKDTTPNGLSLALWSDWQTQTLVVEEPLRITPDVNPKVARSGQGITLTSHTKGRAVKVLVQVDWNKDGKFDGPNESVWLINKQPVAEKENDWAKNIIIPLPTKNGHYVLKYTAYKGSKSVEGMKNIEVKGTIYDAFKIEMKY